MPYEMCVNKAATEAPTHVWIFDTNRRVYVKGQPGPVWREHWIRYAVTGETSRSWLLEGGRRAPKKRNRVQRGWIAFSEAEIDAAEWLQLHKYRIVRFVETCPDAETLQAIAKLIGYEPSGPEASQGGEG
jgi:hypothetical protein